MSNDTLDRRSFIAGSVGAAAVVLAGTLPRSDAAARAACSVSVVLYDTRYSDSRTFAAVLSARGAMPVALTEDIGRLWKDSLSDLYRAAPGAIAGMTQHSDLFISRSFAREAARSRLLFEAHHDSRGRASMLHILEFAPDEERLSGDLRVAGAAWPQLLAQRLAAMPFSQTRRRRESIAGGVAAADHPGSLFSWSIAKMTA